ncbi:universal stress protein [Pseudozobellia thermophila]|uniref:Nucleotide-binding universal stress protein, UspA family n=1 Tax=Pseudozobellia thermophila TaxID=192903 RepID=A0A1M6ILW5_9FLAO|nr:universal stress protein [Pseudozobellia thermophila]SHJ35496.1 Nucleotide-binding universal stress protein, UspA family [Pseudozobellia thermophila]
MKKKHIILPTDFSSNARNAIDYAISLFEKKECTFYILHAFEAGASTLSNARVRAKNTRLYRAIKEGSERDIAYLVKELKSSNQNPLHEFEGLSISDSLLNALGKSIIDYDADYVFMGTKGSSAIKEVFMGSSTVSVLKNLDFCRLVAVPGNYGFTVPKQIAFATNFEHVYSEVELVPLIEMAKLWDSEIVVVHIDTGEELTPEQETCKNLLSERLRGVSHKYVEVAEESKISDAIRSYAQENKEVGMIAMVNYWHSFFEKLTKENVINRVAFHTEVPFLIFPLIDA